MTMIKGGFQLKILSINTSSNVCGVSILEDTKLVCKLDAIAVNSHSETLMPMISDALNKTNLTIDDINLIVCDIGPGSFTGIRIGVATVKAFRDSKNIDLVGITSLECLARQLFDDIPNNSLICSMIDCKNDNCYYALYQKTIDGLEVLITPDAESVKTALSIVNTYLEDGNETGNIYFIGDGINNYKSDIEKILPYCYFANSKQNLLNSYYLGLSGLDFYKSGIESTTPDRQLNDILPLYLKKPQAQRQLEEKNKEIKF